MNSNFKTTKIACRALGHCDNKQNENSWIIYDLDNPDIWYGAEVNKEFAFELVERWNNSNLFKYA